MTNSEILATLTQNEIRTLGDLDRWREPRSLSRWHALAQLVGQSAADYLLARLAVRIDELEAAL